MISNIQTTPPKRRCSLVKKNETTVPKVEGKTVLEDMGYVLGNRIGEGEYAKVKLATSEKHGQVAVKIIDKRAAEKEYLEKYLPREISIMVELKHPNIVSANIFTASFVW